MPDANSLENELKRAQERIKRERLAVQKIKRAMARRETAEKRKIEAQALCALGRGVVAFCEENGKPDARTALVDFLLSYVTRPSDQDAIISSLGGKRISAVFRAPEPAFPPVEVVG
ncbi:hypothetical protein [Gluconobacter sp. P1C6_b]|uniref:hypothetical protein n=1 Tax=Gluconobacter sp. P1C6_b TaxID=2762619 RepID=UPI001C05096F|nr:hypothetical protein [Gluconobacter sp. P1C6_b]